MLNSTLGSSGPGLGISPSEKVTLKMISEDLIEARYQGIVTFTTDRIKESLMPKFQNQALGLVEATLKKVNEAFKEENEGGSLAFEINTETLREDVEFLHYNMYNPVRRANYRIYCLINVGKEE